MLPLSLGEGWGEGRKGKGYNLIIAGRIMLTHSIAQQPAAAP